MNKELEADLKYFAGCALSGLLANPAFSTEERAKYMMMKSLTLERLAMLSAIEIVSEIEKWKDSLKKQEENKEQIKLALVEDPDIPS